MKTQDRRAKHLARKAPAWPRDAAPVAACGQTARNIEAGSPPPTLRHRRKDVTCRACLAWSDREAGHPWLVFFGVSCSLVWARSKREARSTFHIEWNESHRNRIAPRAHEIRLRRLTIRDEWWLVPQTVGQTGAKQWLRAIEVLKQREGGECKPS